MCEIILAISDMHVYTPDGGYPEGRLEIEGVVKENLALDLVSECTQQSICYCDFKILKSSYIHALNAALKLFNSSSLPSS